MSIEIYLPKVPNPLIIDIEDYDLFWEHKDKWTYTKQYNRIVRTFQKFYGSKRRVTVYFHREVLNAKPGQIVDHINRNGMDNRRANLRFCTTALNTCNTPTKTNKTSKYRGVYKNKYGWVACINSKKNGKSTCLGTFKVEEEAAKAFDAKAKELYGEFAVLNFNA